MRWFSYRIAPFLLGSVPVLLYSTLLGCAPAPVDVDVEEPTVVDQPASEEDQLASDQTVADLRKVGAAMMSWLTDQASGGESVGGESLASDYPDAWRVHSVTGKTLSFRRVPYAQVVELLVPNYIDEVPPNDGWGNPYEYSINEDFWSEGTASVRSSGRDGEFESATYEFREFPRNETDHDIVWMDGYLARWPAKDE